MRILAFMTALMLAAPLGALAEGRLTVSGEARVAAVPDMATISLGATGRGKTAVEAMNATSGAVDAILATLRDLGIEARDIQTTQLRVGEQTRWDRERNEDIFIGYAASNTVRVRVRDLDGIGALLSGVLDDGANQLQSLSFGLQDPRAVEDEARRRAVADAMAKAKLYAEAAGVPLGPLQELRDTAEPLVSSIVQPEPMMLEEAPAARDVPVAAGEIEVRAEVTMVFSIGE
ncbi:SIMPL domain-containing protein [Mameliella alba]|nr:SIMPL domain-containing protein [Antarctobacter heliothermus]MBY6145401.1 SIMPL domain-containing protein [Mameliella alba]MCA0955149.1 SIMPL domain-containing protein [Mameliella alba]